MAGTAHDNPAFMRVAAKAWRKLSALRTNERSSLDERCLHEAFQLVDVDNSGCGSYPPYTPPPPPPCTILATMEYLGILACGWHRSSHPGT